MDGRGPPSSTGVGGGYSQVGRGGGVLTDGAGGRGGGVLTDDSLLQVLIIAVVADLLQ